MAKHPADWDFGRPVKGYAWEVASPKADLILQHGLGEYAERYVGHYNRLIPHLNAMDINVYAFDARGHGKSDGKRGITDINKTVEDHLEARKAIAGRGRPLFLFGHSLGGLITAASVAEDQGELTGVVLSAALLDIPIGPVTKTLARVIASVAPGATLTPALDASAISRVEAEVAAYDSDPIIIRKPPTAKLGATASSALSRAKPKFARWQVPVLLVHGDADQLVPVTASEAFFERVPADDKTLEVFPGGYHELLNDVDRDTALEMILGWIAARLPVTAS